MSSSRAIARVMLYCVGSVLLASCVQSPSLWGLRYGPDKPQYSYVLNSAGPNGDKPSTAGDLLIWNPNTNAAYISPTGKSCIQAADVYRVASAAADAQLKADALGSKVTNIDANASSQRTEAAILLASQDVRGTFLSIALFNLCMFASNQQMTSGEVTTAFAHVVDKAASMTTGQVAAATVAAQLLGSGKTRATDGASDTSGADVAQAASGAVIGKGKPKS
ncbi:hypothetical protein [Burkholderia ubonensis]|uniref:hypothetical protein n=1 Tax=Burkholderia ubonensis TaxID=101571 RepID=UPI000B07CDBA|nr:hypothetical protein [Burkholderia ubonensis]